MKPFLESFSEYIVANYLDEFSNSCVIFPSRRAGVFFQKQLASKINKTCWLPKITTLNEFISEISAIQPADQLQLIYKLYQVFCSKTGINESFDEFYFWGQVILSDFNEVDKELVDAHKLFSNLSDIKEIESTFSELSEEQLNAIKQFWGEVDFNVKSEGKEKFLVLWEKLYIVYKEFNEQLSQEKLGYEGKIYRTLIDNLTTKQNVLISYKHIFIVGFNALSKSEQELFKCLQKFGNTEFFWDFDSFYFDDKLNEAGYFIRKMLQNFPPPETFQFETGICSQKNINIYSTQTQVGQAKILSEIFKNSNLSNENTALVLADETMLLPVLYSLPNDVTKLNVTMSYPVKQTPSVQFIYLLLEMQGNIKKSANEFVFKSKDVLSVLNHQFLNENDWTKNIKNEIINLNNNYIKKEIFKENDTCSKIFLQCNSPLEYCKYICDIIFNVIANGLKSENCLEKQILYSIYRETLKLGELIQKYNIEIVKHDTFLKIYKQAIDNVKVAFRGEPLAGLQIMGILETRLLDFENIVLLSVNEGIIPAGSAAMSLIPYNLRKGFGLLTLEHQDAIFAYHFYHLLQRSKNIELVYSSNKNENGKSEASRFIHQLRFNENFKIEEFQVTDKPGVFLNNDISIERTEHINLKLKKYFNNEFKLSPSSINAYINCSLKFYFRYIVGLKKSDELTESIDGSMFGNIFHKTVGLLYQNYIGQIVTQSIVEEIKNEQKIEAALNIVFNEIVFNGNMPKTLNGLELLNYQILKKYIIRLLEYDKNNSPFKIIGIEMNTNYPFKVNFQDIEKNILINCYIDRCIEKEGKTIIQDFKTGEVKNKVTNLETLFTQNNEYSAMRQVIIYSLSLGNINNVKPELLTVRKKLIDENINLTIEKNEIKNALEIKKEFDKCLKLALNNMFSIDEPFLQTQKTTICKYCDYKQICRR